MAPEGIQRVEREQGDRINVFPHLLMEEFVALLIMLAFLAVSFLPRAGAGSLLFAAAIGLATLVALVSATEGWRR